MALDAETLSLAGALVAIASGLCLAYVGWRYHNLPTTGVWGGAAAIASLGMLFLGDDRYLDIGFGCVIAAGGLSWFAASRFSDRQRPVGYIIATLVIWFVVAEIPLGIPLGIRLSLFQFVLAFLLIGTALEFRRTQAEGLRALWPMVVVVAVHGTVFLAGGAGTLFLAGNGLGLSDVMFTPVYVEVIVYAIASAIIFMALVTERELNAERAAAQVDWLTSLLNRGAFVAKAKALLAEAEGTKDPISAILFDLDHFKSINDSYGHATGDTVLQRFAGIATRSIRRSDVIGRIGGEEFAILLPRTGPETAVALAERIREAFYEDCKWVDGRPLGATASAGVAMAREGFSFDDLIAASDRALYASKQDGRNRVQLYDERTAPREEVIVRFA